LVKKMKTESEVQCKFARFDGPRLDPDFSALLRAGISPTTNGIASYTVILDDHAWCAQSRQCIAAWSATRCVWCAQTVASAFLDDLEEVSFAITTGEDGLPCAELTQPHYCPQMAAADKILARDSE
jgi:hypothetical protein